MEKEIFAIGLGPGDYEMVTLKGKRILDESDVIYLSGGASFNGYDEVKELLDKLGCGHKLVFFEYPFNKNAGHRHDHIKTFADSMISELEKGKKVSYVTMGDMTVYSSFPDVYNQLKKSGVTLTAVTGIPSMLAPASLTGQAIVDWKEKAVVMPCPDKFEDINEVFKYADTAIIMKINDNGKVIKEYMDNNNPKSAYAVFNAYTDKQAVFNLKENFPDSNTYEFFMSVVMIKK